MGRNDFLDKQKQRDAKFFQAGMLFGTQLASDYYNLSLHDKAVMGSRAIGSNMISKIAENCKKLDDHFCDAFTDAVDADYLQEEMDAGLREIFGNNLIPFRERYPLLQTYGYMKSRKGWK